VTVGFFSPLPPARSGVADYAEALAEALRARCEVRPGSPDCDVALYHVGNNDLHRDIYRRALEQPGVAVLHDAVLHQFLLGWLDRTAYVDEFVYNYGEFSRGLAERLWDGRAHAGHDPCYFQHAMVRRVAEVSRAVVVHNPAAASIVRQHAPGARVVEIPHLFRPPELPAPDAVERWRARHGIPSGAFLFGVFGYLREPKRLATALKVFEGLEGAALLVAGEFVSRDLAVSLAPALAAPRVIRTGFLEEPEFWLAASAVDACINLRYPSAGETSGVTIRLMGLGKPVLVTAGEEIARFPEGAVIPVDCGVAEAPMLAEYVRWLARNPGKGREIGQCAAAYIAASHSLGRVADQYLEVLCSCVSWRTL
jgi:glycosyltransferase involved in cell wall biosynthesis